MSEPKLGSALLQLRQAALRALQAPLLAQKQAGLAECHAACAALLALCAQTCPAPECLHSGPIQEPAGLPGRPERPALFDRIDAPKRSVHTAEGLAHLIHAVAHIEFNAINLALDALWRFDGMPAQFYADWLQVAQEEAEHFVLLQEILQDMGHDYGSFDAHTGLWDMTEKTKGDITARMALVPRTLEARGLDAAPPMQAKLRQVASPHAAQMVAALDVIMAEEVGHVRIGNHWYGWLCRRQQLDPVAYYAELAQRYEAPRLRAPYNEAARLAAGFTPEELALLQVV